MKNGDESQKKEKEEFLSEEPLEEESVALPIPYLVEAYQPYQLISKKAWYILIEKNPEEFLGIIEENQRQQRQRREQEFELRKSELEYEHQMKMKREENKLRNENNNKRVIVVSIAAFIMIFVSSLIYAARVDDKNLPNTIITAAISLLAGGSTSVIAFSRKKGDGQESYQDSDTSL